MFSTLTIRQRVGHVLVALIALAYAAVGGILLPHLEFPAWWSAGFLGWAAAVWLCQAGIVRQLKGALACLWALFWGTTALVLLWVALLISTLGSEVVVFAVLFIGWVWFFLILALPPLASLLLFYTGLKCISPMPQAGWDGRASAPTQWRVTERWQTQKEEDIPALLRYVLADTPPGSPIDPAYTQNPDWWYLVEAGYVEPIT